MEPWITVLISFAGVILSAISSLTLVNYRINKIEEKLDKVDSKLEEHNNYALKFVEIAGDLKIITNEIKNLKEKEVR